MRADHFERERAALDQLEPQLLRKGYQLIRNPSSKDLPSFLNGYVPDAVAIGKSPKIAVEIKGREGADAERNLSEIRRLFDGRDDWTLQVYYYSSLMPAVEKLSVDRLNELEGTVEKLVEVNSQAAFVLAWSVLEASLREAGLLDDTTSGTSRIIGLLASQGFVKGDQVQEFLGLSDLRNRIIHGQLDIEPLPQNVHSVLELASAVRAPDALNASVQ
jgi:uncharacterized protein YutE (UPF0331/DUF86 family)